MSTGSIAANFHEGSRSEYLAQYIFASFGTAIAVPHHEDGGIDLYCTLTERIGQRAWPRANYTVQVKSNEEPWVFDGAESVRWMLEHPLPLFLCVVDKKQARLRLFKTHARFAASFPHPPPPTVRLHPCTPSDARDREQTNDVWNIALREPILDATVVELLTDESRLLWRRVLEDWTVIDAEAIYRSRRGVRSVTEPTYKTNEPPKQEASGTTSAGLAPHAGFELVGFLEEFCTGYQLLDEDDPEAFLTETLICLLHQQLISEWGLGERRERIMRSHRKLTELLNAPAHVFAGADRLVETIRRAINPSP